MQASNTAHDYMNFWTGLLVIGSFHAAMILAFLWILRF
jgi:hypothetical protein